MSTLSEADHGRLRRAEETWLRQSADRLRRAATERRTTPGVAREAEEEAR